MSTAPYLLFINCHPTQVSAETWKEFYTKEHLHDIVKSGISTKATFYEEIDLPGLRGSDNPRRFLALYQTEHREPLMTEQFANLDGTSKVLREAGADSDQVPQNGDFDGRNYELIQVFDPNNIGEVPAPELITAEMHPLDPVDHDKWYREEHLNMISKLPGYRRTLRYKSGPRTVMTQGDVVPFALAIHEVEDAVKALSGKEVEEANGTEWTKKHVQESNPFVARGWKLVCSEGW